MIYYILLENEKPEDLCDENILGEESFGVFYPGNGLVAFNNIVFHHPDLMETIAIIDEQSKPYSVEEFMQLLEGWKIKS